MVCLKLVSFELGIVIFIVLIKLRLCVMLVLKVLVKFVIFLVDSFCIMIEC